MKTERTEKYNLNFHQAIDIILHYGGAVKGNKFDSGLYLTLSALGELVVVDANNFYQKVDKTINFKFLSFQKYREIRSFTIEELKY